MNCTWQNKDGVPCTLASGAEGTPCHLHARTEDGIRLAAEWLRAHGCSHGCSHLADAMVRCIPNRDP